MEAALIGSPRLPSRPPGPDIDKIKQKLLLKGVYPTPKIIHNLRKKQLQKSRRKSNRRLSAQHDSKIQVIDGEELHFQDLKTEYRNFNKAIVGKKIKDTDVFMAGKPWKRTERGAQLREFASSMSNDYVGEKLKSEHLRELSEILERDRDKFWWLLNDDIDISEGCLEENGRRNWSPQKRCEAQSIRFLVDKLSDVELSVKDWKFSRMMKKSELQFTEGQLLKIVEGLGEIGQWRNASSVVEWVYSSKKLRHSKSRFVYTKLLSVLWKTRRPREALQIFDVMRGDCQIYPDMPAYHCIAVTLGQAGFLKELLKIIEFMREKPAKRLINLRHKNWEAILQPDVVVFNAVLNACVASHQWKGVYWVFDQLKKNGLRPNGATFGLAMEVMLRSGKFDVVHELFARMKRSGEAPKALTYKVLVEAFWEEGKIDEAVQVVRDMERRGVFGTACVYYKLACCLCNNGRWQEALMEVQKLEKLPRTKPLEVTFTGMIMSSLNGGHIHGCISMFQHIKDHYAIDIGIINAILKVYGKNDMFWEAKELFEETKSVKSDYSNKQSGSGSSPRPNAHTYSIMLQASASAHQWEYFESVYKEMTLSGYLLDQKKHVSLLIKAARAGKGYLLEHAFDSMLEADEIPSRSVFMELICQAIVQHDYERAITIVKSLAHAPFQFSDKEWTDLFKRNEGRIGRENLKQLLVEVLRNHDVPMEATVSNLYNSFLFLCSKSDEMSTSPLDFDNSFIDHSYSGDEIGCGGSGNVQKNSSGKANNLCISLLDLDVTSAESGNPDVDELEIDEARDVGGSNPPSADEILEIWKEQQQIQ